MHPFEDQEPIRMRLYIDPIRAESSAPLWQSQQNLESELAQHLFLTLCNVSWSWQQKPEKHWGHWTTKYINYFGPRQHAPESSFFYVSQGYKRDGKF